VAILCRGHDLLYTQVPATGSSVVAKVLREELGGEQVPEQSIRRNGQMVVPGPHCTVPELIAHDVLSRDNIGSCLVVVCQASFLIWRVISKPLAGRSEQRRRTSPAVEGALGEIYFVSRFARVSTTLETCPDSRRGDVLYNGFEIATLFQ